MHPLLHVQTWLQAFNADFVSRLLALLPGSFRELDVATVLSLLQPKLSHPQADTDAAIEQGVGVTKQDGKPLDAYDLKRLQACSLLPHYKELFL